MHVLVTGATGFIGGALIDELGRDPLVSKRYATVRQKPQAIALKRRGIIAVSVDLSRKEELLRLNRHPIDLVCHCAGQMQSLEQTRLAMNTIESTRNLCAWALKKKIRRMIYLSSAAVISGNLRALLTDSLPYRAHDAYGRAKIEAEKIVLAYRDQGLPVVVLRPCSVYGEQDPHFFPSIIFLIKSGAIPLSFFRRMRWHGLYIRNLTAAIRFALRQEAMEQGTYLTADKEKILFREYESLVSGYLKPRGARHRKRGFPGNIEERLSLFLRPQGYAITRLLDAGFIHPFSAQEAFLDTLSAFINRAGRNPWACRRSRRVLSERERSARGDSLIRKSRLQPG